MATILILGGCGFTGKLLARHLLEQSGARIVLAGRSLEKAQAYADQLNAQFKGERVSPVRVDAANAANVREALRGMDLLLVAAPTTQYAEVVVRAALESGVDYLDVQLGAQKLALLKSLAPDIERANRCFITEAGFHPGLPAAMVRYAALQLDRMDSALTACYLNMGHALPYSEAVDELMEVFRNYQAQVFKNGRWTKTGSFSSSRVNFGGAIGVRRCYSMFFEELRPLPEMYPALREIGFYISGSHWFTDWVISPLAMAGLKIGGDHAVRPMGKLVWWGMQNFSKPPHLILLKIEALGEKNGKPVRVEATVSHLDGYELTAIPVVACLLQYLDGQARRPGLWMMGQLAEPVRFFEDLKRMGVQVTSTIT
ncbi:MAG: saccharopine dehydrogenase NADP-binding domain-containing protein [Candidatus Eisenbacteria bacterium]|nr:saccharopine dehydrogenase NADP-binding domain-containing protein [Candidatus Eisenbacteria bacterium]